MISVTNKITGETIELSTNTPKEIMQSWRLAQEFEKNAKELRTKLAPFADALLNERGVSESYGGYMFRQTPVQRYGYDKAKVREYFDDEDLVDTFLVVDKQALDTYVKENIDKLDGFSRDKLVEPVGKAYVVTKLEKLK